MKITVIGSGYVGLVTGACLADAGNDVLCFDLDTNKIAMLNKGLIPIHEPMLDKLIERTSLRGKIRFTTNLKEASEHGDIQIIAVGTPPDEDGSADLSYVMSAAESLAQYINRKTIIVTKSTVPVGTGDALEDRVLKVLQKRQVNYEFAVVSNPEFLREGDAIRDFKHPDRVVIGSKHIWALEVVKSLYEPFSNSENSILIMDIRSAELAKYAANAMLATRISFMNELANLAEALNADIEAVRIAIGSDSRIGSHFLRAGCGYGGSCFPKDVSALIRSAAMDVDHELKILNAVEEVNELQKLVIVNKLLNHFNGDLKNKEIGIWGLAFKPDTDDMREAPSIKIINALLDKGAKIIAYDPVAMGEAKKRFAALDSAVKFSAKALDILPICDALVVVTEWEEFKHFKPTQMKSFLGDKPLFDGRNVWTTLDMSNAGVKYYSIGRR